MAGMDDVFDPPHSLHSRHLRAAIGEIQRDNPLARPRDALSITRLQCRRYGTPPRQSMPVSGNLTLPRGAINSPP